MKKVESLFPHFRWIGLLLTLIILTSFWRHGHEVESEELFKVASRAQTFKSNIDMANAGYFLQQRPGEPSEAVWEDPGMSIFLHLWAPLKARIGLGPLDFSDVYVVQFAILVLMSLSFYAFRAPTPILFLIPPILLYLALETNAIFFSWNLYWAYGYAAIWLVFASLYLWGISRARYLFNSRQFLIFAVMGSVLGLIHLFRRDAGYISLLGLALAMMILFVRNRQRLMGWAGFSVLSLLILLLGFLTPNWIHQGLINFRDANYAINETSRNGIHPMWAPLYLGLGFVENKYGIAWNDAVGAETVAREFGPEIPYGSEEYELALRAVYFRTILKDPDLLFRSVKAKILTVYSYTSKPLKFLFFSAAFTFLFVCPTLAAISIVTTLAGLIVPALTYPHPYYTLTMIGSGYLWFGAFILFGFFGALTDQWRGFLSRLPYDLKNKQQAFETRELPKFSFWNFHFLLRFLLRTIGSIVPPTPIKNILYSWSGLKIGKKVFIGRNCYFIDGFGRNWITLERAAVLSPNVTIVSMAVPGESDLQHKYEVTKLAPVEVGEGAWIGVGTVILPGVRIGKYSIVGANSVVTKDVGAYEVWAGNPAIKIKTLKDYSERHSANGSKATISHHPGL